MNEITQTNFTIRVAVPNQAVDHGVIRLRYLSQNPTEDDRGTTFYQCADVRIVEPSTDDPTAADDSINADDKTSADDATVKDCCAPKQFVLHGYETGSWRNPTDKKYYFDAVNKLFRVDTNSGNGKRVEQNCNGGWRSTSMLVACCHVRAGKQFHAISELSIFPDFCRCDH